MKTKGSTSYTGVTLGELKKYFTDDAVIEVSKKSEAARSFRLIVLSKYKSSSNSDKKIENTNILNFNFFSNKITNGIKKKVMHIKFKP